MYEYVQQARFTLFLYYMLMMHHPNTFPKIMTLKVYRHLRQHTRLSDLEPFLLGTVSFDQHIPTNERADLTCSGVVGTYTSRLRTRNCTFCVESFTQGGGHILPSNAFSMDDVIPFIRAPLDFFSPSFRNDLVEEVNAIDDVDGGRDGRSIPHVRGEASGDGIRCEDVVGDAEIGDGADVGSVGHCETDYVGWETARAGFEDAEMNC
jgi:hypothetical protein